MGAGALPATKPSKAASSANPELSATPMRRAVALVRQLMRGPTDESSVQWLRLSDHETVPVISSMDRALLTTVTDVTRGDGREQAASGLLAAYLLLGQPRTSDPELPTRDVEFASDQLLDARSLLQAAASTLLEADGTEHAGLRQGAILSAHRAYWQHLRSDADLLHLDREIRRIASDLAGHCRERDALGSDEWARAALLETMMWQRTKASPIRQSGPDSEVAVPRVTRRLRSILRGVRKLRMDAAFPCRRWSPWLTRASTEAWAHASVSE